MSGTAAGAAPWRLGVLGRPVTHSRSPTLQRAALASLGLEGEARAEDVDAAGLAAAVEGLRRGEVDGWSVTLPHKARAARHCDRLGTDAERLGAVNALGRGDHGEVVGWNTDAGGLADALEAAWPDRRWDDGLAVVLGAGGAALAAGLAAARTGARELVVANRTPARAEAVASTVDPLLPAGARAAGLGPLPQDATLVLQATPLGMDTVPGDARWEEVRERAAAWLEPLGPEAALLDLVYRPRRTPWAVAAEARGLSATDGLEMLIRQAARAIAHWTGRWPDLAAMRAAL